MRVKTELSVMPPEFSVVKEGRMASIIFYTDVQEVKRDESTVWTAEAWEMDCVWTENLESRIAKNPALWLARAKSVTAAEEATVKMEQLKVTATDDAVCELAELVAYLTEAVVELSTMIAV